MAAMGKDSIRSFVRLDFSCDRHSGLYGGIHLLFRKFLLACAPPCRDQRQREWLIPRSQES